VPTPATIRTRHHLRPPISVNDERHSPRLGAQEQNAAEFRLREDHGFRVMGSAFVTHRRFFANVGCAHAGAWDAQNAPQGATRRVGPL